MGGGDRRSWYQHIGQQSSGKDRDPDLDTPHCRIRCHFNAIGLSCPTQLPAAGDYGIRQREGMAHAGSILLCGHCGLRCGLPWYKWSDTHIGGGEECCHRRAAFNDHERAHQRSARLRYACRNGFLSREHRED